jgi:hypothetical protein
VARDAQLKRRVREDAAERVYVLSRAGRGRAVVLREQPGEPAVELLRTRRRLGVRPVELADAVLRDALDSPPSRKLAMDYARFVVPRRDGVTRITARDLQAWLDTWQPPLSAIFKS